jgi:hypothetical protein
MTKETWNNAAIRGQFKRGTDAITADSTIPPVFSFLKVVSAAPSYSEGGMVTLLVEYAGAASAQYGSEDDLAEGAEKTYRLEGRLTEKPFSQHPKWKDLSDAEKFALGELIEGTVKPNTDYTQVGTYELSESFSWALSFIPLKDVSNADITLAGDAIEFAIRIARGETTFLSPTVSWTETTQGNAGMTAAQLNKLGHISTPRGNPPTPTGDRDWMLTGATQEQRGELYQTTIEWTLSEREGHDAFLYS